MSGLSDAKPRAQVAIIGYAARLPQARDADAAWRIFKDGTSVITRIEPDRWSPERFVHPTPGIDGATYTDACGQIDGLWDFDAAAFGISPREAVQMDPQHRLLLEVTAEAIDAAGLDPERWDKPRTGVFIGASSSDHSNHFIGNYDAIDAQFMLGNTLSIMSNRISYQFDAHGPSYTVDTACSSSFYALHNAVQAIRNDEIDTAIVGAVNVLLSPMPFVGFSHAAMLAPDGRCKPFDAAANGYVRSEGAVVFIIRRADLARMEGDCIRTVIAATEINSDGRTTGMSLPSPERQEALLNRVIDRNCIAPDDLAFIEAHGTGTAVGDPAEATAIGQAIGRHRATPLPIGSAKSNFGHLEPASGLLGLLKAQMSLERDEYPATINHETPNPNIDFNGLNLRVADEPKKLPQRQKPWFAGINSFGFGGANSHVVIRQPAPAELAPAPLPLDKPKAIILTAASAEALQNRAKDWTTALSDAPETTQKSMINAANHRLRRHAHRLVVTGDGPAALRDGLALAAKGQASDAIWTGRSTAGTGKIGFVFSGNGSQWIGMGRAALAGDPGFRKHFADVGAVIAAQSDIDVEALIQSDDEERVTQSTNAQPLLFAVQVALVKSLADHGVLPDAALGHSLGEVAASWCSGSLTLEDAAHLVLSRSRALEQIAGLGSMAAVMAGAERLQEVLSEFNDASLCLSADNSPRSTTITGPVGGLDAFAKFARKRRVAVKRLAIDYPYHGPAVEAVRETLFADLAGLKCAAGHIPYFSSTRGREISGMRLDAEYWWDNARSMVKYRSAVAAMVASGCTTLLEIGPRPVLRNYSLDTAEAAGSAANFVHCLADGKGKDRGFAEILAHLFAVGAPIDEAALTGARARFTGIVPRYPWDHVTYRAARGDASVDGFGTMRAHMLLGPRLRGADPIWINRFDAEKLPFLGDHVVRGRVIMPAMAMVEMVIAATQQATGAQQVTVEDFDIAAPIEFKPKTLIETRTVHEPTSSCVTIAARQVGSTAEWHPIARATVRAGATQTTRAMPDMVAPKDGDADQLYQVLTAQGLDYGPAFRRVVELSLEDRRASLKLDLSGDMSERFALNPMLADAALHGIAPLLGASPDTDARALYLPVRIGRVRLHHSNAVPERADIHLRNVTKYGADADVILWDHAGRAVADIAGLSLMANSRPTSGSDHCFWVEERWQVPDDGIGDIAREAFDSITLETPPDPDDGAVLLDAMAHRAAWDLVAGMADADGRVAFAQAETDAQVLLRRSAAALDAAGVGNADDDGITLGESCPWPEIDKLSAVFAKTAPDWAPVMLRATALADNMRSRLDAGLLPASGRPDAIPDPQTRALWQGAVDFVANMSEQIRNILVIGPAPLSSLSAMTRSGVSVTLSHPDAAQLEALRLLAGQLPSVYFRQFNDLTQLAEFDLVILCDAPLPEAQLKALLQSGDADIPIISLTRVQSLFGDLSAGQHAGWFRNPRFALDMPEGGAPGRERVLRRFAAAGVTGAKARALNSGSLEANVVIGQLRADPVSPCGVEVSGRRDIADVMKSETGAKTRLHVAGTRDICTEMAAIQDLHVETDRDIALALPDRGPATGLTGLGRVLQNEWPDHRLRILSYNPDQEPDALARQITQTLQRDPQQIRIRPRKGVEKLAGLNRMSNPALRLMQGRAGAMNSLKFEPVERRDPGPNEVEIEVIATGLNYRDVMWAQGLLPREALEAGFTGATLGMECTGRVVRAGPESGLRPGVQVVALTPHGFSTHVTVPVQTVFALPEGMDPVLAAGMATIFMTAQYALVDLARMEPGETVLIHGGCGGVGLAACQVAKHLGARIIATAGTPEKRAFLCAQGIPTICDSRSLEFFDQVMGATDGQGVDVVLNALAGAAQQKSLETLRPFGRFIEIGKRDFFENSRLAERPFRNNLTFYGVDMDQFMAQKPERARNLATKVMEHFASGHYTPTPTNRFDAAEISEAFRAMQRSAHLGKIVVTAPKLPKAGEPADPLAGGAWLVTGGTSGFGYASAEWLISRGVSDLWLVSRSGDLPDLAMQDLERRGIRTHLRAVDVADAVEMDALFTEIDASGVPLIGVIHGAMVLRDGIFATQSAEDWTDSLGAKVAGAENLDRLTRHRDLRHFLLFSSVTTLFGNPGQAAYVTANSALEAIARARRLDGLPALAIGWGPIADVGVLSRSPEQRGTLARQMGEDALLSADRAFELLDMVLDAGVDEPAIAIAPMNWSRLCDDLPILKTPLFNSVDMTAQAPRRGGAQSLAKELAGLDDAAAIKRVTELLIIETAEILRQPPSEIDPHRALTELGFDSLMAVNLRMATEEKFDVKLPLMALADGMTLAQLAGRLRDDVGTGVGGGDGDLETEEAVLSHVSSDTEIDAVVLEKMRGRASEVASLKETING